jgi:hypothetical protein
MGNFWSDPTAVHIQSATQSGSTPFSSTVELPLSSNQPEGAVFTFDGWVDVNDFTTTGYGQKRMIFSRGDCPGLYIDSTSNSFLVMVATYGATESIMISNIPSKQWIYFAIIVSQYAVDVYINGTIRQHHTLTQLPKQGPEAVQIAAAPGFDGQVGGLTYYSRALSALEIAARSAGGPPPSLIRGPGYASFAPRWYFG